jgi:methylated-DNA-[protein]-cysteine S-methyltransferase
LPLDYGTLVIEVGFGFKGFGKFYECCFACFVMGKSFNEKCYDLLGRVPGGRVTSYGEIARALGSRGFRAVGNAMNNNLYAPEVACHRVVRSNGEVGGFVSGTEDKVRMLKVEGVDVVSGKVVDFEKKFFRF